MTAFAPGTREVVLEGPSAPADVELTLVSRTQLAQNRRHRSRPPKPSRLVSGRRAAVPIEDFKVCPSKEWADPIQAAIKSFLRECRCPEWRRTPPRNLYQFPVTLLELACTV